MSDPRQIGIRVPKHIEDELEALSLSEPTCPHTYFDGRSAVTQVKWSDKGFIGRCVICNEIIEN